MLQTGDIFPTTPCNDETGTPHSIVDYRGSWVLVYCYPKDDTPGCTIEACTIRDAFPDFTKLKIAVLGISADAEDKHAKFIKKYNLPFPLLADTEHRLLEQLGVWQEKKMMGKTYMGIVRTSFLVNPQGTIEKIYTNVVPSQHAADVLHDVAALI